MLTSQAPSLVTDDVLASLRSAAQRLKGNEKPSEELFAAKILIVDDEPINVRLVRKFLSAQGYRNFVTTTESVQSIELIEREQPDLLVLDVMMPGWSGLDVLRRLRADARFPHLPVLVLTALSDRDTKLTALELGATDFLSKPLDPGELLPRVHNVLKMQAYQKRLAGYSTELEAAVVARTTQLERSRIDVVHCLARAAEFRDDDTGRHVVRVGSFAGVIARSLGLDDRWCHLLELAAQLHDVGKLGIPDAILLKQGKLDSEEWQIMQSHCALGGRVFDMASDDDRSRMREHVDLGARILDAGSSPLIDMARTIALTHHEKWDGSGYPRGLTGENIPLEGRITAVADVFDALSSRRPYKPAFSFEQALQILRDGSGKHFDPQVLEAFMTGRDQILAVQSSLPDAR